MNILLLGANGQIGDAVQKLALTSQWPKDWKLTAWSRQAGDFSQPIEIIRRLEETSFDLIWNTAAYTQVDLAETEKDLALQINGRTPARIAEYCAKKKIPFIHYSTDYVYRGDGNDPHVESEAPHPQGEYGRTKLAGDEGIAASGCDHLIFRTSWVYSTHGKNFVKTMLRLSKERPEIKVVSDQIGSPSYAPDLALYTLKAILKSLELKSSGKNFPSGVYHLCNSGFTTWYEFAKAILPHFKVIAISSSEFPTPAKRPINSKLSLDKLESTFSIHPRPWQEALRDCLSK